jgi:hypothetical protein
MKEEESLKDEREILRHFENLKTGLLKALQMGVFKNFEETAQIKISIAFIQNYIEKTFVGVEFDK